MAESPADLPATLPARLGRILVPALAAVLVAGVFAAFWWLDRRNARIHLRGETRVAAEQVTAGLQGAIHEHAQLVDTVGLLLASGALESEAEFRRVARAARTELPALVALRRVTADGSVRWRGIGGSAVTAPERDAAAVARRRAVRAGGTRFLPVAGPEGRVRQLSAYRALGGAGDDLLEAVFDARELLAPVLGRQVRARYQVRVRYDGRPALATGDRGSAEPPVVVTRRFTELDGAWTAQLVPVGGVPHRGVRLALLAVGGLAALLALWLARRLDDSRRRLRASEARFRDFADIAADWFWETDAELRYVYLSERYEEVTGIPRRRVLGRQRRYVLGEAGVDDDELRRQEAEIEARRAFRVERTVADADGRQRVYVSRGRPVFDQAGRFAGYRGIGRDITEQRELEQRLRQAAAVFDGSAEAVVVTDPDQRIVRVNRAFTEMTGYDADEVRGQPVAILHRNAHDPITTPAVQEALRRRGRWRGQTSGRRRDGGVYTVWQCISAVRDDNGRLASYVFVMLDIAALEEYQLPVEQLAHHDDLTGLANRLLLETHLRRSLQRARRQGTRVGVLCLDVDHFNAVNDHHGHAAGDAVLGTVAGRLAGRLRAADTAARVGDDEFVVVLDEVADRSAAAAVAAELAALVRAPIAVDGGAIEVTASIGMAIFADDGDAVDSLLDGARAAMQRARDAGGGRCCAGPGGDAAEGG